ncbi:hypothetical protein OSB04_002359 [Centaurea solstitialis]|uniref:HMA domain-containing protein n=1 Tax=Centaurea solstitialis TaxID=347529 RepID=A0AA38UB89_9ASTR|nr:hypothetical protein OSB04_002359 [Centaurea solstitialis]
MASPHKVTKMVLDVDLSCSDCYKKVKKVICKIPEIRDQEYDVEKNKVKISVISCCPDKIRDKLSHKAGTSIQKIEIVVEKPKDAASAKPKPDAAKPKPAAAAAKPKADHDKPKTPADDNKPPKGKGDGDGDGDGKKPQVANKMMFEPPVHGYPQIMYPPTNPVVGYGYGYGYGPGYGYEGSGAPFPAGYGYGMPPQPSGYGSYYDDGYNYQNNNMSSTSHNNSYENPEGCSVM